MTVNKASDWLIHNLGTVRKGIASAWEALFLLRDQTRKFIDDWFSPDRAYDQDAGLSISILDDYYTAKERVVPWDT